MSESFKVEFSPESYESVKKIAEYLHVSEEKAVVMAINRLYRDLFVEISEDPPTDEQIAEQNRRADIEIAAAGGLITRSSLFDLLKLDESE